MDTNPESTANVKQRMLPLQGPNMWQAWAKHDKEQHRHINRGSREIEQYNSEKEKDKVTVRRKQIKLANPPTSVMELLITTLLQHKGRFTDYFLQWLKLLLDDRSRSLLSGPHRQFRTKRWEMGKLKDQQQVKSPVLINPFNVTFKDLINNCFTHHWDLSICFENLDKSMSQCWLYQNYKNLGFPAHTMANDGSIRGIAVASISTPSSSC